MLTGIDINEVVEYSAIEDTGEKKTIFVLKSMPKKDLLSLVSGALNSDGSFKDVEKVFDVLKTGIKEIRGLQDKKSKEPKNYTEITDDVLNLLSLTVLSEILNKIVEINTAGEKNQKN